MRYVIVGFGKFGRIALERLVLAFHSPPVIVVESGSSPPARLPGNVRWIAEDAVSFLKEAHGPAREDVIIPMVPFHLAAAWIVARSPLITQIPLPMCLQSLLPHALPLDPCNLCASKASFLCPDDCPEGDVCTMTGEPREPLFADIAAIAPPGFTVLVQRSFQILPGIGGYLFGDLVELERCMTPGRYVVATSCKCHAILTGLGKAASY
jgi:hypothetical protein